MKEAMEGFNIRLRKAMQAKGWNQKVLAERSGIHYQQLYKLLKGERPDPRLSTARRLADVLEVTTDYLAGLEAERDSTNGREARKVKV